MVEMILVRTKEGDWEFNKEPKVGDLFRIVWVHSEEYARYFNKNWITKGEKLYRVISNPRTSPDSSNYKLWSAEVPIHSIKHYVNVILDNAYSGLEFTPLGIRRKVLEMSYGMVVPGDGTVTRYISQRKKEKGDVRLLCKKLSLYDKDPAVVAAVD